MSLLDAALKITDKGRIPFDRRITDEDIELVIAYFDKKISLRQLILVKNKNSHTIYTYICITMCAAWERKYLTQ